jgi:hypothetical protein
VEPLRADAAVNADGAAEAAVPDVGLVTAHAGPTDEEREGYTMSPRRHVAQNRQNP